MEYSEGAKEIRTMEGPDAQRRYELISQTVKERLKKTALLKEKPFSRGDIEGIKETLIAVAPFSQPRVFPNYWDHLLLASIYAHKLAEKTGLKDIQPLEAQALGFLHDLGRLVIPHRYLRTNLVENRLAQRIGIRKSLWEKQSPVPQIIGRGRAIKDLEDLTPPQRLMDVADNLSKMNPDGTLFDIEEMKAYDTSQPRRYGQQIVWPSEKWGIEALEYGKQKFATDLALAEIAWLENEFNVDFAKLRKQVWEDFKKPQNQQWLFAIKEAQETLDLEIDRLLERPSIKTIVFDFGNVLTTPFLDERLFEEMAKNLGVTPEAVNQAILALLEGGAMAAVKKEEDCLREFYKRIGQEFPGLDQAKKIFVQPNIYVPGEGMQKIVQKLAKNPDLEIHILSDAIEPLADIVFEAIRRLYPKISSKYIFISSREHASKREIQSSAFKNFLEKIGNPDPQTVLFIDDIEKYTTSARALWGMRSFYFGDNPFGQKAFERLEKELEKSKLI